MQQKKVISSAEKGTTMHTMMQHLPLDKLLNINEILAYLEVFIDKEIITTQEAATIDINAIAQFYTTDIAQYMMNTPNIKREVPFSLSLSASEVYTTWSNETDEQVLIQGVIDCLVPLGDKWIIRRMQFMRKLPMK